MTFPSLMIFYGYAGGSASTPELRFTKLIRDAGHVPMVHAHLCINGLTSASELV